MKKETPIEKGREVVGIKEMAKTIVAMFKNFDIPIEMVEMIDGYSNYHFHIRPTKPVRMKAFASFLEDLKYELGSGAIEILAPIPNQKLVGITVEKPGVLTPVLFSDALKWEDFTTSDALVIPLGIDEFGDRHLVNITRTPHLLLAGTTGSGKSVLLHSFINALLEKNTPEELRLLCIDPKRVELTLYAGLPHLLTPPITHPRQALRALSWVVKEMERRYEILVAEKVQHIAHYHHHIYQPAKVTWEKAGAKPELASELPEPLPYIVIIIDELNDLMQAYPKELEALIIRIAQMSRPVGIHMILSTQRPSVNVITGALKANIPTRIALAVASQIDSRTIIDTTGAEKLRGSGDMLYLGPEDQRPVRIQTLLITDEEVMERVKKLKTIYGIPKMNTLDLNPPEDSPSSFRRSRSGESGEVEDDLYEDAKAAVIEAGRASTSYLQRKLRIGYSRAALLMDLLEETGIIGPADGSRPREVRPDTDS